ncbi:hypothetical protein POTOM_009347 [Populus tomentosa]|uniref:NADH:quinone oxidoreductase/Mrp antiporter transmembrane domain-containing protein n=1 Tax=Populus tomentosa TaxID=118781 RepID=A0A8X8A6I0_POPTO|nr:hypothetical protein POTOM_009347 [Populus tomentosa]
MTEQLKKESGMYFEGHSSINDLYGHIKSKMGEISGGQKGMREGQKEVREKSEETREEAAKLKEETNLISQQSAANQLRLDLMSSFLVSSNSTLTSLWPSLMPRINFLEGLASSFPFTYAMMLMRSLSRIGFPFLTGFYSKDVILELAYTKYTISGNFDTWQLLKLPRNPL